MKRKGLLTILLVFGFLFTVFFLFALLVVASASQDGNISGEGVGVVEVIGPIMTSRETVDQLRTYADNDKIKAIVVRIDSPGGAVAPSQEIYQAVLDAKKKKKVIASMGSVAASGGYYIACAADVIYANPGTVTGSIGVITQITNFEQLAELAKVDVITVKSGKYKDVGNPFRAFTEEDRSFFTQMIMNIYDQFVRDVAKARGMKVDEVKELADGRVYTGEQAKKNKLVDELGGLEAAIAHAGKEGGFTERPKVFYPPKKQEDMFGGLLKGAAQGVTQGVVEGVKQQGQPAIEYRWLGPN